MPSKPDPRQSYPDLLGEDGDPRLIRLVADLDAAGRRTRIPADLIGSVQRSLLQAAGHPRRATASRTGRLKLRLRAATPRGRLKLGLLVATLCLISVGAVFAASNLADLGKPTNAVSPYAPFPLSGFMRMPKTLRQSFRLEVLIIGTQLNPPPPTVAPASHDPYVYQDVASAVERWAVVKALDQFGTFSGLTAAPQPCSFSSYIQHQVCADASFDWTGAEYRSRYLTFVHKDLLDPNGRPLQKLTAGELGLYRRYFPAVRKDPFKNDPYSARLYAIGRNESSPRHLPLIVAGNYAETQSEVLLAADLEQPIVGPVTNGAQAFGQSGYSFDTLRQALKRGVSPPTTTLVPDVNAEANIIVALVCHGNGMQPSSVCSRPGIKQILKHVK